MWSPPRDNPLGWPGALGPHHPLHGRPAGRPRRSAAARGGARLRRSVERGGDRRRRLHALDAGGRVDGADAAGNRDREPVHARARAARAARGGAARRVARAVRARARLFLGRDRGEVERRAVRAAAEPHAGGDRGAAAGAGRRARARRLQARAAGAGADLRRRAARPHGAARGRAGRRGDPQLHAAVGRRGHRGRGRRRGDRVPLLLLPGRRPDRGDAHARRLRHGAGVRGVLPRPRVGRADRSDGAGVERGRPAARRGARTRGAGAGDLHLRLAGAAARAAGGVRRPRRADADPHAGLPAGSGRGAIGGVGTMTDGLAIGPDGVARCWWGASSQEYAAYHDDEWGKPVRDDDALYEKLCLEAFQSGLSWITILRKRENFRAAFAGFEIARVAEFGEDDVARLMADTGIVRNRAKIDAAIANARAALAVDLTELLWSFAPEPRPSRRRGLAELVATTPESVALAKALKKHGF